MNYKEWNTVTPTYEAPCIVKYLFSIPPDAFGGKENLGPTIICWGGGFTS